MNVLETLKINNATVLNIKDGDILFVKVTRDCNDMQKSEIADTLIETLKGRELKNVGLWITSSIDDIKIIRR